jgi:hypothetical protein
MNLKPFAVLSFLALTTFGTGCASTGAPRMVNHARLDSRSDMGVLGDAPLTLKKYRTTREADAPAEGVF